MASTPALKACVACGRLRPRAAHGWCQACYCRWTRHGRPEDGPPPAKTLQPCGTDAGYQRHIKIGEKACQPCLNARNDDQRRRRGYPKSLGEPTPREQWTAEQTRTAHNVALATEDNRAARRLLLEVLGLAAPVARPGHTAAA